MYKKKIYWTYLIDNFERDLAGVLWWIYETDFNKGDKVCLLPTKELSVKFLYNQKPDVIVWNYARNNNIELIKIAKYLNIFNIIHDTEGIHYDMKTYFNIPKRGFKYIDEIWCWGKTQKETLVKKTSQLKIKPKIMTTGSIRYEYIKSLKKNNLSKNINKILWNTNYAALSPRYQTVFREYKEFYKLHKYATEEESFKLFLNLSARRQKAYEYIEALSKNNKSFKLTIRPHPFESSKFYKNSFLSKNKKVKISEGCDINYDLANTSLVIQNGCQTVLESFIKGIPSIKTSIEDINIWSKVTPYLETNKLVAKFNDIHFLNKIHNEQKKLFRINKINLLIDNLFNKLKIEKSFNSKERRLSFSFHRKAYLIFIRLKILTKDVLIKNVENSQKKKKVSTHDIVNFVYKKYKIKTLSKNNLCIIYPK